MAENPSLSSRLNSQQCCDVLYERYNALLLERGIENRADEKFRQDHGLQQALIDLQQARLRYAKELQQKQAYREALEVVNLMLIDDENHTEAVRLQQVLQMVEDLRDEASALLLRLGRIRDPAFKAIVQQVAARLKRPDNSQQYKILVREVHELLDGRQSVEDFIDGWNLLYTDTGQALPNVDQVQLGKRITDGKLALFLGTGIAQTYLNALQESALAQQLAQSAEYATFNGTLSAIAEYYQRGVGLGRATLLEKITPHLARDAEAISLYQTLAKMKTRLVLISAAYDDLLEQAFRAANKPFVTMTSIIQQGEYSIGHVWVSFSDGRRAPDSYPKDDISRLSAELEAYSILYKIRGTCSANGRYDALTLAESDYFNFARHAEKIIPNYVIVQLQQRGVLFVGYAPSQWEERLLANALLDRLNQAGVCHVLHQPNGTKSLEDVFWQRHGVTAHAMNIRELDQCLQGVPA